jgi:hypothetical protein
MLSDVDGYFIAAQIRLARQIHKGTILIVEGETDASVLDRFIDRASCEIEVSQGKANALEALDLLEDEGFAGVVAIVDADFDRLTGKTHQLENLCVTDLHDLDLMIFCSRALEHFVRHHAVKTLFSREFNSDFGRLRERIILDSLPLACCRLASHTRNLKLHFKSLRHQEFLDLTSLKIDSEQLVAKLIARSRTACSEADLNTYMLREAQANHDPYQLANGHDVAAVLGLALRHLLADKKDPQTYASEVESGLRLAFDWEAMILTKLYDCLRSWEVNNQPFKIFRPRGA